MLYLQYAAARFSIKHQPVLIYIALMHMHRHDSVQTMLFLVIGA